MRVRGRVVLVAAVALVGLLLVALGWLSADARRIDTRAAPLSRPVTETREAARPSFTRETRAGEAVTLDAEPTVMEPPPEFPTAPPDKDALAALQAPLVIEVLDHSTQSTVAGAFLFIQVRDLATGTRTMSVSDGHTDADGRWAFEPRLGRLEITATTDDGRYGRAEVLHEGAAASRIVRVWLDPFVTLDGIVLDDVSGAPIEGATVSAMIGSVTRSVITDEAGRFHYASWIPVIGATLTVKAAGYGPAYPMVLIDPAKGGWAIFGLSSEFEWQSGDPFIDVRLAPDKRVRGRVVQADGEGVADATVHVVGYVSAYAVMVRETAEARTDEHGLFEVPALHAAIPHLVECTKEPLGSGMALAPSAEGTADVGEIVLRPLWGIVGQAVDSLGQPLVGARVEVRVSDFSRQLPAADAELARSVPYVARVIADVARDGSFAMQGIAGAQATLTISLGRDKLVQRPLALVPGAVTDVGRCEATVPVELVRGLLLDASDQPLADVSLAVLAWNGRDWARIRTAVDGGFELAVLRERVTAFLLVASDERGDTTGRWHATLADGSPTLTIGP